MTRDEARAYVQQWAETARLLPVASDPDGAIAKACNLATKAPQPVMKDSRGAPIEHVFIERTIFVVPRRGQVARLSCSGNRDGDRIQGPRLQGLHQLLD
jgi:hypothetical protein